MSDFFLPNKDLLTNYTQISGACVRYSASLDEPRVSFNPKLSNPPTYGQEILVNPDAVKVETFTDFDFFDYAEKLKAAGNVIVKAEPDVVLVPMRGGVRPWQHLRIYCNLGVGKSVLFPFTDKDRESEETRSILATKFGQFHRKEHLSIVCIDAAEGGQGSEKLVRILESLHAYDRKSCWNITLCLFVPAERKYAEWGHERERTKEPNFKIEVKLFGVRTVIGEDMDAGMIAPENFGKVRSFKTQIDGVDYLVESAELPGVIDQKILEKTHYSLLAEPFSTVIDIRLWKP